MQITNQQIKIIHTLLPAVYKKDKEQKQGLVYQFTEDHKKTSTKDLSFKQANDMIIRFGGKPVRYDHWGLFDAKNASHKKVLSLCQEIGWSIYNDKLKRNVADLYRLSEFLKSPKSPVTMPLKQMTQEQISRKLIPALEGISNSTHK